MVMLDTRVYDRSITDVYYNSDVRQPLEHEAEGGADLSSAGDRGSVERRGPKVCPTFYFRERCMLILILDKVLLARFRNAGSWTR